MAKKKEDKPFNFRKRPSEEEFFQRKEDIDLDSPGSSRYPDETGKGVIPTNTLFSLSPLPGDRKDRPARLFFKEHGQRTKDIELKSDSMKPKSNSVIGPSKETVEKLVKSKKKTLFTGKSKK